MKSQEWDEMARLSDDQTQTLDRIDGLLTLATKDTTRPATDAKSAEVFEESSVKLSQLTIQSDLVSACGVCTELESSISKCTDQISKLLLDHTNLFGRVSMLHRACSKLAEQRKGLGKVIDLIDDNLLPFREAESCNEILLRGNLGVFDDRFPDLLHRIDTASAAMVQNSHFAQAEFYLATFRHLQAKALGMVKDYVIGAILDLSKEILLQVRGSSPQSQRLLTDAEEAQLLYARFQAIAPPLKALSSEIESRKSNPPVAALLLECHQSYFRIRLELISPVIQKRISSILESQQQQQQTQIPSTTPPPLLASSSAPPSNSGTSSLTAAATPFLVRVCRLAVVYMSGVCKREQRMFSDVFSLRHSDTSLMEYLQSLCSTVTDALRPKILHEGSVAILSEVLSVLRSELNEVYTRLPHTMRRSGSSSTSLPSSSPMLSPRLPASPRRSSVSSTSSNSNLNSGNNNHNHNHNQQSSDPEAVAFIRLVKILISDVQERLIYRVQLMIRDEILNFTPTASDLDYPNKLTAPKSGTSFEDREGGDLLYPPLATGLQCLALLYESVETGVFEGLAQDIVEAVASVLQSASTPITKRSGHVHGMLFLVQHLLTLRERIGPFNVNFSFTSRKIDFQNMQDYLSMIIRTPQSLLHIRNLTHAITGFISEVRVRETRQNPKRDVEKALKEACESLINTWTRSIVPELFQLLDHVTNFAKTRRESQQNKSGNLELKDQPFAKVENITSVLSSVRSRIAENAPKIVQQTEIYLTDASTRFVLLKPVRTNIIEAYGSLISFIQAEFVEDEWKKFQFDNTQVIAEELRLAGIDRTLNNK